MPNPTINPNLWAPGASFTVTQTNQLFVDVRVSNLDADPCEIEIEPPPGATIRLVRNPVNWTTPGTDILTAGVWSVTPVALGDWTVTAAPGSPAVLAVTNPTGATPQGLLRLVISGLGGASITIAPGGGDLSIDRLIADPSISNVQVISGTPVEELDDVQLSATLSSTVRANLAPVVPLLAAPPVIGVWTPDAANPVAVKGFTSSGSTATFKAPAIYAAVDLDFQVKAALDLASNAMVEAGDPSNTSIINVPITTVKHRMVLVLDRSGSMFGSKWDETIKAAHAWVDLFRALRPGADHQAGIITFEHDPCSWSATPADDIELRDPTNGNSAGALSSLASFADVTTIDLGAVQSCTPIGDAIVEALQVIEAGDVTGTKGSIVLLTDGYENSGQTTLAPTPPPGVQTLASRLETWPGQAKNVVGDRVFVLAVGSTVDEDRLNKLPTLFGQTKAKGYYRLTNDLHDLLPAFTNMLGEVLDAEQVLPVILVDPDTPPHSVYFQVPAGEQRVAFLVPWSNFNDEVRVGWRQSGTNGSFTLAAGASVVVTEKRGGHGIIGVDLAQLPPGATDWRVQHIAGAVAQPLTDADVVAVRDLRTAAEITFDRAEYFIGDSIRFTCAIRSGGAPVTGASIAVDSARPGEGLGTFLATNSGRIQLDREGADRTPYKPDHAGDPDHGKGLMFKTLLQITGQSGLAVIDDTGLMLLDDGAHGDGAANDGDYSNAFVDTLKEGTYTFRFRVSGQLPDGSPFSRVFTRSTWVGVRPDPAATVMVWHIGAIDNGLQQATLTITPKTKSGELLGPYRQDVFAFKLWDCALAGDLVDKFDGSYTQTISYGVGGRPTVIPEVYGEPLNPSRPTDDVSGKEGCLAALLEIPRAILRWIKKLLS